MLSDILMPTESPACASHAFSCKRLSSLGAINPRQCCTWTGGGCLNKHQTRPQGHELVHTTMSLGHGCLPSPLPSRARRGSADVLIFEQPTSLLIYVWERRAPHATSTWDTWQATRVP